MTDTETNQQDPHAALEQAAQHLYDAECALHIARQTRVDAWITAAERTPTTKHASVA